MNYKEVEKARKVLNDNGYFVENLWSLDDVYGKFDCSEEEAYKVLKLVLFGDGAMNSIWDAMEDAGAIYGLKKIEK